MSKRKRKKMTPAQAAAARWDAVDDEPETTMESEAEAEERTTSPKYWLIAVGLIIVVFIVGAFLTPGA